MKKNHKIKKNLHNSDSEQQDREVYSPSTLSEEEIKIISASRGNIDRSKLPHYDNSDIAIAKRYAKSNKFTVIFVSLTVLLVLVVTAVLGVFLLKKIKNAPSKNDFLLTLGDKKQTVKYTTAMTDEGLYLDLVTIARYAELIISGDPGALKISCKDGTYVRFENGKNTAVVNGETVKLGGKAKISQVKGEEKIQCLVPFSFIQKLFSNEAEPGTPSMYVSYSDKTNKIQFQRITYKNGDPLPISFSENCFEVVA